MINVTMRIVYDLPGWYEEDSICFRLSPAYSCSTSEAAHSQVIGLLNASDWVVIMDDEGGIWEFWPETVKEVHTSKVEGLEYARILAH